MRAPLDCGGEKNLAVIDILREKVRDQEYEFTSPHFFEEMAHDDLTFAEERKNTYLRRTVDGPD